MMTHDSLVQIRTAEVDDAEPIAGLLTALGYPTASEAMRQRLAAIAHDSTYSTFVAVVNSRVVGVAGTRLGQYYEKDGTYCQLLVLSIDPAAQRQGIGRRLLKAVEEWTIGHNGSDVVVTSGLHRAPAHAFYERCGYAQTGLRFVRRLEHPLDT
jgi:GNAT superfamily N-acetyltransferase